MRLVFWQDILSQIDLPYIVELTAHPLVGEVVVVANNLSSERQDMGWDIDFPNLGQCVVITNPSYEEIHRVFQKDEINSVHLFTGLRPFPHVFRAFKISLEYRVKRAIISERPMTYAWGMDSTKPLWMHRLRFILQNWKFIGKVNYVFEIGECACHYYKSISKKWKVFPFAYCTRDNCNQTPKQKSEKLQVCFVGSLTMRKGTMTLLKAVRCLKRYNEKFEVNIIGRGPEEIKLKRFVAEYHLENVHFKGIIQNKELASFLVHQDVLVLPSIHDGWGAVINEALLAGLFTICSDRCGGKELLGEPFLGKVFEMGNSRELASMLKYSIDNIVELRETQDRRRKWAEYNVCGKAIANYLVDCISEKNPIKPWAIKTSNE